MSGAHAGHGACGLLRGACVNTGCSRKPPNAGSSGSTAAACICAKVMVLGQCVLPSVCRDELLSYDPYDEGTFCRSRFWLLMVRAGQRAAGAAESN